MIVFNPLNMSSFHNVIQIRCVMGPAAIEDSARSKRACRKTPKAID